MTHQVPQRVLIAKSLRWALLAVAWPVPSGSHAQAESPEFVDLSLMVGEEYPCTWPSGFPPFQMRHYLQIGPRSAYNSEILTIDGNTGTQIDVPPHSIPRPGSDLANAGPLGDLFTDKVEAWQFVAEACVIDVAELLDTAPNGQSSLIKKEHVVAWEKKNRPLRFGDAVLFHSGYNDKYYKPLPEGRRFLADPVEGLTSGWPDPDPECMEYLGSRGVKLVGVDSPSMGPIPDLAEPTHLAGLKHGMIFTEGVTGLGNLPVTGSFYGILGPKHADGPYGEGRAFAIPPSDLAKRLTDSAREKKAVDLSVTMSPDMPLTWTGKGVGHHRHPYVKANFLFAPNLGLYHHTHMFDSHVGTHLVPPSYALPADGFDNSGLASDVREWLAEFEKEFGPRKNSSITTEQVPISWTSGEARVIDVRHLVGTSDKSAWPASPEITKKEIADFEAKRGELEAGDVVIFQTGHTDAHFKPGKEGSACIADPLNGKSEGWPAPNAEAIVYLASKGVRCVAIDAPSLGGVDPKRALATYWALGNKDMVGVEFLTNVDALPDEAYFLFAPIKIEGCHGGPGRAIALY